MANIIRVGGGAGGSQPTLITKSITQNGTYNASSDNADGYSSVEVDVAGGGGSFIPMITSSGSQYIELPINGNGDYTYKFKLYVPTAQNEKLIFGSAWNVGARLFHFTTSNLTYYISNNQTYIPYNTGILDVEASTDYIIVNQIKYTGTAATRISGNIKLFGISGSDKAGVMGIGEFKVYDNSDDSLVMDLVPMEDSSTGAGYYHDTVGNTDYYSDSSTDLQYAEIYDGNNDDTITVFENGQWVNSDKIAVVTSTSGASGISIVDNKLVLAGARGNGTGFSLSTVDTTKAFLFSFDYEATGAGNANWIETGRCVTGADAGACINSGTGRYSYHDSGYINTGVTGSWSNINTVANSALFLGINGEVTISKVYAQIIDEPLYTN